MTNKEQQSTQKPTFSSALCSNTAFLECGKHILPMFDLHSDI